MPLGISPPAQPFTDTPEQACIRNVPPFRRDYIRLSACVQHPCCARPGIQYTRTRVYRYRDLHANHESSTHNSTLMEFGSNRSLGDRSHMAYPVRLFEKKSDLRAQFRMSGEFFPGDHDFRNMREKIIHHEIASNTAI